MRKKPLYDNGAWQSKVAPKPKAFIDMAQYEQDNDPKPLSSFAGAETSALMSGLGSAILDKRKETNIQPFTQKDAVVIKNLVKDYGSNGSISSYKTYNQASNSNEFIGKLRQEPTLSNLSDDEIKSKIKSIEKTLGRFNYKDTDEGLEVLDPYNFINETNKAQVKQRQKDSWGKTIKDSLSDAARSVFRGKSLREVAEAGATPIAQKALGDEQDSPTVALVINKQNQLYKRR